MTAARPVVGDTLRTDRVLLRPPRISDLDALVARRNEPEIAVLQSWALPYLRADGEALLRAAVEMGGPQVDRWWMLTITDPTDSVIYGDLALRLKWEGRTAEIGFTLARKNWRQGYASESAAALIEHLFVERDVHRVEALLHPDNRASAHVLERCGLLYEGRTRDSYWVAGQPSDDLLYGMLRDDWQAWLDRPRTRPDKIELIEVTPNNAHAVERLRTHHSQRAFVSSVTESLADAFIPEVVDGAQVVPWYRAITADGDLVGFVMMAEPTEHHVHPYLWRLLIDRRHQRRGIGTRVLDLVVAQCRDWGANALDTSWNDGRGSPEPVYLRYGFVPTGRIVDGEIEGRLELA
ncbi:MAG: GNAT family N-acetyltransferase [Actinomycetota bacterium]